MSKRKSKQNGLRSLLITGAIVLLIGGAIIVAQLASDTTPQSQSAAMNLDPQIITNLTLYPQATALSGEAAGEVNELRTLVDACPDYADERRSQMEQHLDWLLNPASIPPDILIAFGANPPGKLLFGMATYTSIQWRLDGRNPDSCLVPISMKLDEMLVAAGEPPFAEGDDNS